MEPEPPEGRSKLGGAGTHRRHRIVCLILPLVAFFLASALSTWFPEDAAAPGFALFLCMIVSLVSLLYWCHFDASDRGFRISRRLNILLLLLFAPTLLYYFIASRRWGAWRPILASVLYVVAYGFWGAVGYELGYALSPYP